MSEQPGTPHIRRTDSIEFELLYPDRLTSDQLEEERPLSLMLRTPGEPFEAYELSVKVEQIQRRMGSVLLTLFALDHDLQPMPNPFASYPNSNNDWTASEFYIESKHGDIEIERGYFIPPQTDEYDNLLSQVVVLDQFRTK